MKPIFLLFLIAAVVICKTTATRAKRALISRNVWHPHDTWGGDIRYYVFRDSDATGGIEPAHPVMVDYLRTAMKWVEENTCVKFTEMSDKSSARLVIYRDKGSKTRRCSASVGGPYQNEDQKATMDLVCDGGAESKDGGHLPAILHELFHTLGLTHEQYRFDRDQYVKAGEEMRDDRAYTTLGLPYDFGSIVHYGTKEPASAYPKDYLYAVDPLYSFTLAGDFASFLDYFTVNLKEGCLAKCSTEEHSKCANKGYAHPKNCQKCVCPIGFTGERCEKNVNDCGASYTATSEWQTAVVKAPKQAVNNRPNTPEFCVSNIKAPSDKSIEVKIVEMEGAICRANVLEVKSIADLRATGPKFCDRSQLNTTFTSFNSMVPLVTYSYLNDAKYTIAYRYVDKIAAPPQAKAPCVDRLQYFNEMLEAGTTPTCEQFFGATAYRPNITANCLEQPVFNPQKQFKWPTFVNPDHHFCAKFCGLCDEDLSKYYPGFADSKVDPHPDATTISTPNAECPSDSNKVLTKEYLELNCQVDALPNTIVRVSTDGPRCRCKEGYLEQHSIDNRLKPFITEAGAVEFSRCIPVEEAKKKCADAQQKLVEQSKKTCKEGQVLIGCDWKTTFSCSPTEFSTIYEQYCNFADPICVCPPTKRMYAVNGTCYNDNLSELLAACNYGADGRK